MSITPYRRINRFFLPTVGTRFIIKHVACSIFISFDLSVDLKHAGQKYEKKINKCVNMNILSASKVKLYSKHINGFQNKG